MENNHSITKKTSADYLEECRKLLDSISVDDYTRMLERPWMEGKKIWLGFKPRTIAVLAVCGAKRHGCGPADLDFLIRMGVEMGDDLKAIATAVKPDHASEFRRLTAAYGVASRPFGSESVTLSRLCSAFPTRACWYLHKRPAQPPLRYPGALSLESVTSLSPDYPPAMMTFAFAFLVPNMGDAYCTLLMKAHMFHEYFVQSQSIKWSYKTSSNEQKDKVIAHVVRRTVAAIAFSWVSYDVQVDFLKRIGLVRAIVVGGRSRSDDTAEGTATAEEVVAAEGTAAAEAAADTEGTTDKEEIVVAEHVAAAARKWDEMDSNKITFHQILPLKNIIC